MCAYILCKEKTLALYVKGLIKPIKFMMKAKNPKTIKKAKIVAS